MSGILDQVITSKHLSKLSDFDPHQTLVNILTALSEREQEIIKMRHGLSGSEKKTLEDIGKKYNVTRERIRQIENTSLKKINKNFNQTILKEIEEIANTTLSEHGGLMSEDNLTNELLSIPGTSEENKAAIRFILNQLLNHRFYFVKESKQHSGFWKTPEAKVDLFHETVGNICELIDNHGQALILEELMNKIKETDFYKQNDDLTDKVVVNFITVTKKLKSNPYDEWGLIEWANITPRRMNDKIYLVLKKNDKPMHFTEIAKTINEMAFDHRQAYPATIHNELILDEKYVLVGRGIYALKEWGYKPGVVADVIADILKESDKPLTKKEIIKAVLEKRLIKETTITLALMNKDRFTKDEKGRYSLKTE
ncbi:MAG: hypothetical protein A2406_02195 [Candidatus Komeilibacteria bacterium RIFOXYC1_FULL_37_11]|uniref:HTH HARE-type domain-containing protein n=1 Tax=Candidatus Komeilibacteria bacterium RIFOXYC1_FULL_37_11 TaxID=1798555 RepID=A0A1G2BZM1_9BACT|nr:MAG: hypothetical protein A2406_02195 [Candidatus Komeilibacteria bacterium RIFOXYC1_FULL_37_11]OGY95532.1 MAG: hypothetical protein A2611_02430 [Candidatus Komeilibacteria bacterium RIFOXYD1_FULL_37_29]